MSCDLDFADQDQPLLVMESRTIYLVNIMVTDIFIKLKKILTVMPRHVNISFQFVSKAPSMAFSSMTSKTCARIRMQNLAPLAYLRHDVRISVNRPVSTDQPTPSFPPNGKGYAGEKHGTGLSFTQKELSLTQSRVRMNTSIFSKKVERLLLRSKIRRRE
jgi:hypothetical protein